MNRSKKKYNTNNNHQRCNDIPFLLLYIFALLCLVAVGVYSSFLGNPRHLYLGRDSSGNLCEGNKSQVLYHDPSKCADRIPGTGCSTIQVCVEECPETYWASIQGISSGLEKFCVEKRCPSYLLPSISIMGRCVPQLDDQRMEERVKIMINEDGDALDMMSLLAGVKFIKESIEVEAVIWPRTLLITLLTSLSLVVVVSLLWGILIFLVPKVTLIISICFYLLLLLSFSGICFFKFLKGSKQINNFIFVILGSILSLFSLFSLISVIFLFSPRRLKMLENIINHVVKTKPLPKLLFFLPIVPSSLQIGVIVFALISTSFLITSGQPIFAVVDSCPSESCINENTGKMFVDGDFCEPKVFEKCTGCASARCIYQQLASPTLQMKIMIAAIFAILTWSISTIHKFGCLTITNVLHGRKISDSLKTIGSASCLSLIPSFSCQRNGIHWITGESAYLALNGGKWWQARKEILSLRREAERLEGIDRLVAFVDTTSKLMISGIVLVVAFFLITPGSWMHPPSISKQFVVTLSLVFIVSYIMSSNFISLFKVIIQIFILKYLTYIKHLKEGEPLEIEDYLREMPQRYGIDGNGNIESRIEVD